MSRGEGRNPIGMVTFYFSTSELIIFRLRAYGECLGRSRPMKDVVGCDKPRGAAKQALIRGFPNGETPRARVSLSFDTIKLKIQK